MRVALQVVSTGQIVGPLPQELADTEFPVEADPRAAFQRADELADAVLKLAKLHPSDVVATVVALGAPVDHQRNLVGLTGAGWRTFDLSRDPIRYLTCTDDPIFVNDANLGALAETRTGAAAGDANVLYMKWARGVGFGLIVDGELRQGKDGFAGEHGHTPVVREPEHLEAIECVRCHRTDCLEALTGFSALVPVSMRAGQVPTRVECARFIKKALDDPGSTPAARLREAAEYVGRHLGAATNLLNPDVIVVGGLLAPEPFLELEEGIRRGFVESALPALSGTPIVPGQHFGRAGMVGAFARALEERGTLLRLLRSAAES